MTQTQHRSSHQPGRTAFDLPAATHSYLARAAGSLQEAMTTSEIPVRYACAHVAALRATAALLAARATPSLPPRRGRQQKNAWVLLAEIAPELSEWAAFFAAGAAKRAAAESGSRRAVTEREADDLVRDADRFLGLVEESLGMTRHVPVQELLPTQPRRAAHQPDRPVGQPDGADHEERHHVA
jgi:SAV_6107-like HEPN